jgi:phage tail protein X
MLDLETLIAHARGQLPASHRALLEQVGLQDTVVHDWPSGVRALYLTLGETPPRRSQIEGSVALWLPARRVVAYNGRLLTHALGDPELTASTRQAVVDNIAWHEYGHALSVTRASPELKRDGPRLLALLPPGLRSAIDYPGTYRRREVFDEVIAHVYALMIRRAVQFKDYGVPTFLHRDLYQAFQAVVPWPPDQI